MRIGPDHAAELTERRGLATPLPPHPEVLLNPQQQSTLRNIEGFGWRLAFIRHPLSQSPLVIVIGPDGERLAALDPDGRVDLQPGLRFRRTPG